MKVNTKKQEPLKLSTTSNELTLKKEKSAINNIISSNGGNG